DDRWYMDRYKFQGGSNDITTILPGGDVSFIQILPLRQEKVLKRLQVHGMQVLLPKLLPARFMPVVLSR
ncbi:MAG: hypothetical protein WKF91_16115, partial [Segetibacter sp.]